MAQIIALIVMISYYVIAGFMLGGAIFFENIFLRIALGLYSIFFLSEFTASVDFPNNLFGLFFFAGTYGSGIWLAYRYTINQNGVPLKKESPAPNQTKSNSVYSNIQVEWPEENNRPVERDYGGIKRGVSKPGILWAVCVSLATIWGMQNFENTFRYFFFVFPVVMITAVIGIAGIIITTVFKKYEDTRQINWMKTGMLMFLIIVIPVSCTYISIKDQRLSPEQMIVEIKKPEVVEEIEASLKNLDKDALTENGVIKTYEIDYSTVENHPTDGIMFTIYVNGNKDLYTLNTLTKNHYISKYSVTVEVSSKLDDMLREKHHDR